MRDYEVDVEFEDCDIEVEVLSGDVRLSISDTEYRAVMWFSDRETLRGLITALENVVDQVDEW